MQPKLWAYQYRQCQSCGTTDKPHKAKGLCTTCYYRQYQRKRPPNHRTYDEGLHEGRAQVITAIDALLQPQGGSCTLRYGTLVLEIGGVRLRCDLD